MPDKQVDAISVNLPSERVLSQLSSLEAGQVPFFAASYLETSLVVGAISKLQFPLLQEEWLSTSVSEIRRREFVAGRTAARLALRSAQCQPAAIRRGQAGAPVWPPGVVGSISHNRTFVAAAVAKVGSMRCVGLDIEENLPLPDKLQSLVVNEDEECFQHEYGEQFGRVVFSAKEALFKADWPRFNSFLDFHDIQLFSGGRKSIVGSVAVGNIRRTYLVNVVQSSATILALAHST